MSEIRRELDRKSTKNRRKIDEKSMKFRSHNIEAKMNPHASQDDTKMHKQIMQHFVDFLYNHIELQKEVNIKRYYSLYPRS